MAHQCVRCGRSLPEIRGATKGAELCPVCSPVVKGAITGGLPDPDILIADIDLLSILKYETVEAACPACSFHKNIPIKYAGLRVKCPKCALVFRAQTRREPAKDAARSFFRCASCNLERPVPPGFLGKRVRCPRCRNISLVSGPTPETRSASQASSPAQAEQESERQERRTRERVFVQNVDLVMGILGDFRCRDLSASGVGFFPGRGDWDFHSGSTINFDLSFRKKPLIRNLAAKVARTDASMVGCHFTGLSNLQEQLLYKLMKSQRFQMAVEDSHPVTGGSSKPRESLFPKGAGS